MFATVDKVNELVAAGKALILAGEDRVLRSVAPGNWIGGTIPYFMTVDGGVTSREGIFVQEAPAAAKAAYVRTYDLATISRVGLDSPDNGYTLLILPAFTPIHQSYALNAPSYADLFLKVIAGWIAGIHLDDLGKATPQVFDGRTGDRLADRGVALHIELPDDLRAEVGVVNIFEPGDGPDIVFPVTGFEASECRINGQPRNFGEYFIEANLDKRLPLVVDALGTRINVSIRGFDAERGTVQFFAPVFEGAPYRVARDVGSYPRRFAEAIPANAASSSFACNCVLNYLYGELEGNHTGHVTGPMTFGEIAYQLLNQTMVYLQVVDTV